MNRTEIPWAHYGWSPVTGCDGGCVYCYARRIWLAHATKALTLDDRLRDDVRAFLGEE